MNECDTPSTKLSVRSAVICSTLTEDIVAFSGQWDIVDLENYLNKLGGELDMGLLEAYWIQ
mgnify:CR=1 FL=1